MSSSSPRLHAIKIALLGIATLGYVWWTHIQPPEQPAPKNDIFSYAQRQGVKNEGHNRQTFAEVQPLKPRDGALSWDIFRAVKEQQMREETAADGSIITKVVGDERLAGSDYVSMRGWVEPLFTEEIKKLDGQEVRLHAYMFPLEEGLKQRRFLIGAYPANCPFDYHSPSNMIIEVRANTPIEKTYHPILISGKLELIPQDKRSSLFYRLWWPKIEKIYAE